MKTIKLMIPIVLFAASVRAASVLAADMEATNLPVATTSQSAPMTLMINGPSGRGSIPVEFWVDKISIGKSGEHLERGVGLFRVPESGCIFYRPTDFVPGGVGNLLKMTNDLWLVPEVGLVRAHGDTFINLYVYTEKSGSRAEARSQIEKGTVNQEKPSKGGFTRGKSQCRS